MMDQIALEVTTRNKGPNSLLNNLRNEGYVPGVLYGTEGFNQPIQVNQRELAKLIRKHGKSGIIYITIDNENVAAKLNEIQRNPVDGEILHVDLQRIDLERIVQINVPIHLFGQAKGVKSGGLIQQQIREIELKALPSFIPDSIHVNVSDLDIGDALYVGDISIPDDVELLNDKKEVILTIIPPRMSEELENEEPKSEPEVVNARDGRGVDAAK